MNRLHCKFLALALLASGMFWGINVANAGGDAKGGDPVQKANDAKRKAEQAKQKAEEALREAARLADEAKKAEDAVKTATKKEDTTKKDVAKSKSDDAKKVDEAKKKSDEAKKADDMRKVEAKKKSEDVAKKRAEDQAKQKAAEEEASRKRAEEQAKLKAAEAEAKRRAEAAKTIADLPKDKDGYALLLGKDLGNWFLGNDSKTTLEGKTESPNKHYQFSKDTLVLEAGDKRAGSLRNVKQLNKRFQMKFEFRADKDGTASFNLGQYGFTLRDFSKSAHQRLALKNFKPGEWNTIEITIEKGVYSAQADQKPLTDKDAVEIVMKDGAPVFKVNGKTVELGSFQLSRSQPIVTVKCNGEDVQKGNVHSHGNEIHGQVSVRAETGKVEIRNLRLKEIN